MINPPDDKRLVRIAACATLLIPAWLMLWSAWDMWLTYSPTPWADQWENVYGWRDGPRDGWLKYLFSQHNEHRIFFPRLVFLADWKWFQGRDVLNLVAIGLIQLAGAAFFIKVADVRKLAPLGLLALAVAISLIFCMIQWENLFWGFQVQFVGVYAAAAWAIWLFCRAGEGDEGVRWGPMAGALTLLVIATFSLANGVFAGAVMVALGLATRRPSAAIMTVGAATVVLLAIYLHDYHRVEYHAPPSLALHHPGRFATYVCAYLGGIWWPGRVTNAVFTGLIGIASSAGMFYVVARKGAHDAARMSLLGVVLFVGAGAATTSFGRLNFGLAQSMAPRYMTPTAYFWGAQALFWALTFQHSPRPILRHSVSVLLMLLLVRILMLQSFGETQVISTRGGTLVGTSALLGDIDDPDALRNLFPNPGYILEIAPFARATHVALFADPPVATVGAPFVHAVAAKDTVCLGYFDTLGPAPEGRAWRAMGWGWDRKARRAFDRIVLVDGSGTVIGIGISGVPRPDVKKARPKVSQTSGWSAVLNHGAGAEVTAYGITAAGPACELGRKTWPQ